MTARFIAFEGGEASGKSTQARRLADRIGATLTFEPGATEIGRRIRRLLLDRATVDLDDRAEALLMLADRAQHVAEVVRPALARGTHVVTDRFSGSTCAYQGYGRGLDVDELARLSAWAAGGLAPDLVVLLDVPTDLARSRRSGDLDRIEAAGVEFHDRVVRGFRALAEADPDRWVVVDGSGPPDEVAELLWRHVTARLPDLATGSPGA